MKETLQTSMENVKKRLSGIDEIAKKIRRKLEDERKNGIPDENVLEENVSKLTSEEEQLSNKIQKVKAICKKRREEIEHWQKWFKEIDAENKAEEKKQLENELKWRQKEISEQESKINDLYVKKTKIGLEKVEKEVQKEAIKQGAHKLPINEDPRLRSILEEKKELLNKINFDSSTFNLSNNGK